MATLNGRRIELLMLNKGWELKQLSEKTGLSITPLTAAIKGKSEPRNDTVKKIADALEVLPIDIVTDPALRREWEMQRLEAKKEEENGEPKTDRK